MLSMPAVTVWPASRWAVPEHVSTIRTSIDRTSPGANGSRYTSDWVPGSKTSPSAGRIGRHTAGKAISKPSERALAVRSGRRFMAALPGRPGPIDAPWLDVSRILDPQACEPNRRIGWFVAPSRPPSVPFRCVESPNPGARPGFGVVRRPGCVPLRHQGDPVLRAWIDGPEALDVAGERVEVDLADEPVRAAGEDRVAVPAVGEEVVDRDPVGRAAGRSACR